MMAGFERVLAHPSSLSAREALAAEWRAAGDPRAALVEVQLQYRTHRVANTTWRDEANALVLRIHQLVSAHGNAWAGEVATLATKFAFHRGCIAEITLPGASFARMMPRLVTLAPVQHVNLMTPLDFASVVASPAFAHVTSLAIEAGEAFGDAEAAMLAHSPHARNLRWLHLAGNAIDDAGVEALAASPHLATCRYLDLRGNPVDPSPDYNDITGVPMAVRSARGDEFDRKYGPLPWLALREAGPPDRDEASLTA